MKQVFFVCLLFLSSLAAHGQRIAFVDVEQLLNSLPEYKAAQQQLDQTAERWKQDIAAQKTQIDEAYRKYMAEQVLLSESARKQRQDEITAKEEAMMQQQKLKFGPSGELFKKRQELVRPVQEKVYKAVEEYAKQRGFDCVFDKLSGQIIYTNPEADKTSDVLKKLGSN